MPPSNHNFRELYLGPTIFAKQLETRWFHRRHYSRRNQNVECNESGSSSPHPTGAHDLTTNGRLSPMPISRMPFLRRNLSYIRDEQLNKASNRCIKRRTNNSTMSIQTTIMDGDSKKDTLSTMTKQNNELYRQENLIMFEEEKKQDGGYEVDVIPSTIETLHSQVATKTTHQRLPKISIMSQINSNQMLKRKAYHLNSHENNDVDLKQDMMKRMRRSSELYLSRIVTVDDSQHCNSENDVTRTHINGKYTSTDIGPEATKDYLIHPTNKIESGQHQEISSDSSDDFAGMRGDSDLLEKVDTINSDAIQHEVSMKRAKLQPAETARKEDSTMILDEASTVSGDSNSSKDSDESWSEYRNESAHPKEEEMKMIERRVYYPKTVSFYYPYFDKCIQVQREMRLDFRCPFCFFDGASDRGLLLHCNSTHDTDLSFTGANDSFGNLHVLVKNERAINDSKTHRNQFVETMCNNKEELLSGDSTHLINFVYVADSLKKTKHSNFIPTFDESKRSQKEELLKRNLPIRQYYNSKTKEPKVPDQWNIDSDDEYEDDWLHDRSDKLMDDLADMERCEATFMKMWNRFIKSHIQIPDCAMPEKCREFISTHAQGLVSEGLRQHLLQHLLNLWDNQVLSADHMHDLMALFDTFDKKLKAANDSNKLV